MEQSDNMLVSTLKDHLDLPQKVQSLSDIKAEQLFLISLTVLQFFKTDTTDIKVLASKQQKFRSMAKLNQNLQQVLETQFQLNDLMNPSMPFLRKFMLALINKLGSGQSVDKLKDQVNDKNVRGNVRKEKQVLNSWLKEQWIHPSLISKKQKYRGHILPLTVNKAMLKNNINLTQELNNSLLKGNTQATLNATQAKLKQRVKQFEANEGLARKQYEENQLRLQNIIKTNKDDWSLQYNKLNKIKKKIMEDKPQLQSEIVTPQAPSVFKQELQQAEIEAEKKKQLEEIKPKPQISEEAKEESNLNPMELLKKQAENKKHQFEIEIRDILHQLQQRKDAVENWQKEKEKVQEKMITDEEKMTKLKQQTIQLKRNVEKRQTILSTLEGQKDIEEEIGKLDDEIKMIENQAKQQVDKLQTEIKDMQEDSKAKIEALSELKAKLNKIQGQYSRICEQIVQKQQLKGNVKIMKSNIPRLYYHKKISEMEIRWREQEKQTKKLKMNLQEVREKTRLLSNMSNRVETEIDNILNSEKKSKNEEENKILRDLIGRCKETFQTTLKTLEEVNDVKMQTQDYEVKVHTLSGKNFKQNIDKILLAMKDLKKQMAELTKSKAV